MGAKNRRQGSIGERYAERLLSANGWKQLDRRLCGMAGYDIGATDPDGVRYCVEVKHVEGLKHAHLKQAKDNAVDGRWALLWLPHNFGTNGHYGLLLRYKPGARRASWEVLAL